MNAIQVRKLRFDIDALAKGVKLIDFPLNGHLLEVESKLLYAKAWLGKSFAYMAKPTVEEIAEQCHEANRRYCESIGDNTQVEWNKAEDWQKESAINGVKFKLENPDITPEQQHENWMKDKKADGWKYGKKKDAEKKTHPCMVPYEKLPEDQRLKDEIFQLTIAGMTSMESPYKNDGKRKFVSDIEPTAESAEDYAFPANLSNVVQKADFLRQEIHEQIKVIESVLVSTFSEAIVKMPDWNDLEYYTSSMYKTILQNVYQYLSEARFELGFYLGSLRNS